jgi:hypothetical protein
MGFCLCLCPRFVKANLGVVLGLAADESFHQCGLAGVEGCVVRAADEDGQSIA